MNDAEREAQIRRFVDEVWNGRNYEAAADLYSEDYVNPFGKGPAAKAAGSRQPASVLTIKRSPMTCTSRSTT